MTKAQTKQLETIIGKIEALQHRVNKNDISIEYLERAKTELLRLLRKAS